MNIEKPTFKHLCFMYMQQLTNFPYIEKDFDAITDYQLLCKVVEYLNKVIENSNEQNTAITNLYNAFITLKDYIDNYFDNLDVQDEIDNKLDEMVEDGTLEGIIAGYLQTQKIYNTHVEMIADADNLVNGLNVQTLGYYTLNDGGGAFYQITNTASLDEYQEDLGDNLYATLLNYDYINIKQLGAKGDGITDDTAILKTIFEDVAKNGDTIYVPSGVYVYNEEITCTKSIILKGNFSRPYAYNRGCFKNTGDYGLIFTSINTLIENIDFICDEVHDGYGIKMICGRPRITGCSFDHFENSSAIIIGDENTYYNTDLCYIENVFVNHSDIGINFGGALSQSSLSDNNAGSLNGIVISNCRIGMYFRNSQANNILSLEVNNCSDYGIYFDNSSNNFILNPYLENVKNIYFDTNSVNNKIIGSRQNGWLEQNEGNTDANLVLGNSQGKGIRNIWTFVKAQSFTLGKDGANGYFDITHEGHAIKVRHSQSNGIIDLTNDTYKQTTKTNTLMLNSAVPLTGTTHNYGGLTDVTIPANGIFKQDVSNSNLTIESDRMLWHGNVSFATALPNGVIASVECRPGKFVIKLYNTTSTDITYSSLYTILAFKAMGSA